MTKPILEVAHVSKSVTDATGTLDILRDIDFQLERGETVAIVGASGSGKSTLLSIMAGLDTPTHGTVRLAGEDLFARDEDARAAMRAQYMGFVFQSFQLLGSLTALENVMLALELGGRPRARENARSMLERVGLGERLHHYPRVLSGGEQQRVALARAFVVQPAVLLADEPTGSLDKASGERVMALMMDLNQATDTTLVLVTHDAAISQRCQRRIAIEGHTDERGGREYNLALGQKRSEAVRKALNLLGVSDGQIEAVSLGKEKPAMTGSTEEAFAKNRRAEIAYK